MTNVGSEDYLAECSLTIFEGCGFKVKVSLRAAPAPVVGGFDECTSP